MSRSHAAHEHIDAYALELGAQARIAGHRTRVQQRLVLPGPGFLFLVFGERADARDQHAALARGAQPHVDFVESSGRRVHGEQVDDALGESDEEHLDVHRLRGIGLGMPGARVVQKDQIEVRGVTELIAA